MFINNDNYLTINDFHNICRTCTSKSDLKPIYENIYFVEMLQFCTMLQFNENDNLPKQICQTCISVLHQAYNFTTRCKTIDTALRKCVTDYEKALSIIKTEKETLQNIGSIYMIQNEPIETLQTQTVERNLADQTKLSVENRNVNTQNYLHNNIESIIIKNEPGDIRYDEYENVDSLESESYVKNESVFIKNETTPTAVGRENEGFNKIQSKYNGDQNYKIENLEIEELKQIQSDTNSDPNLVKEDESSSSNAEDEDFEPSRDDAHPEVYPTNGKPKERPSELPSNCPVCHKSFTTKSYFKIHFRIHSGERPYNCNVCGKLFSTISTLNKHLRIHTGERPYNCDICQKSFNRSDSLTKHKRIHSGEKPYSCDKCNKLFISSSSLSVHRRVHTRLRPFSCDLCPKMFKATSDLNKHKKIMHKS